MRDLVDKGGGVQVLVVLVVQEGELVASCRKQTVRGVQGGGRGGPGGPSAAMRLRSTGRGRVI